MADHPVGVNLCGALGIQMHHLEVPEVSLTDGAVFRAHIINVKDTVIVKVIFASISSPVTCHQGQEEKQENRVDGLPLAILCLRKVST